MNLSSLINTARPIVATALVVSFTAISLAQTSGTSDGKPRLESAARGPRDGRLPKLPAAISSFGAAVADGSLYVYGGHIGKAHAHSRDNLAKGFWRLDLEKGDSWEELPMREPLQGLAVVAWKGSLIRVGGVNTRNAAGEPSDMHSTAVVEKFDPATRNWTALTPLPEPRSSFDSVVVGDRLFVV